MKQNRFIGDEEEGIAILEAMGGKTYTHEEMGGLRRQYRKRPHSDMAGDWTPKHPRVISWANRVKGLQPQVPQVRDTPLVNGPVTFKDGSVHCYNQGVQTECPKDQVSTEHESPSNIKQPDYRKTKEPVEESSQSQNTNILTEDEREGLHRWGRSHYDSRMIQLTVLSIEGKSYSEEELPPEARKIWLPHTLRFLAAIKKTPQVAGTFFRGMRNIPTDSIKQGQVITFNTYSSMARNESNTYGYAGDYLEKHQSGDRVILEIQSTSAVDIGSHFGEGVLDELLISPDSKFEVISIEPTKFPDIKNRGEFEALKIKIKEIT